MALKEKLAALTHIYRVYETVSQNEQLACRKGCAHCCTCNVAMTTLEGIYLYDHLVAQDDLNRLPELLAACEQPRYRPQRTINEMAALAEVDAAVPEEQNDPRWGKCRWLKNDLCPVYTARPLACRSMNSTHLCHSGGHAEMDPYLLTVANVCAQFIEHVDAGGLTGNMADVMRVLSDPVRHRAYRIGNQLSAGPGLRTNIAARKLMIPPHHRQRAASVIAALQDFTP